MSVHKLPATINELEKAQVRHRSTNLSEGDDDGATRSDSASSSTGEDNDEDWDDWVSNEEEVKKQCLSLFDGSSHPNADAALAYDKETFSVNLQNLASRLHLDFHGRARLVNYIRKEKPSTVDVNALTGQEAFFASDDYLIPAIQDDPLLQLESDDWSEDEDERSVLTKGEDKDKVIQILTRRLEQAKKDLMDFRVLVEKQFRNSDAAQALDGVNEDAGASSLKAKGTSQRDDDTHYFDSYGENEIHCVMLRDKVRTSTYASFILDSPDLFRDAVVLDVGCGTGILSLFAARAGAKRVFAVDASENIVKKAREIVKINGLDDVITVINGKVEDITLPDGVTQVDVVVSEWMGYALLYESMLDSVLVARDRFLKPMLNANIIISNERGREGKEEEEKGGVIAPSQTRMLLGLSSASEIVKDRIEFWSDVYGYDMSPMVEGIYDEAITEVVDPETLLTDTVVVKDINLATVSPHQLSFSAPFELYGTSVRKTVAHAFILYFDVFFTENGAQVGPDVRAHAARDGEPVLADVWRPGSPGRARSPSLPRSPTRTQRMRRASSMKVKKEEPWKSFTTGPGSVPTHWKQTLFLLKEPIVVREGTVISGTFHCRKSADNSRELDIEIHYVVRTTNSETSSTEESAMYVQSFKVR